MEFGAFVNFFGKQDGLVHISQLTQGRPETVGEVVKEGQEVYVKLLGFDDRGKVRLSMKIVDQATGKEIPRAEGEPEERYRRAVRPGVSVAIAALRVSGGAIGGKHIRPSPIGQAGLVPAFSLGDRKSVGAIVRTRDCTDLRRRGWRKDRPRTSPTPWVGRRSPSRLPSTPNGYSCASRRYIGAGSIRTPRSPSCASTRDSTRCAGR